MKTGRSFQAVIWDLGGVLLRTEDRSGREAWESRLGLARGELDRVVFAGEIGRKAALGQADAREVWAWVQRELQLDDEGARALRRDFWRGDRIDHQLVTFIRRLRQAYRSGLLSNAWPEVRQEIDGVWKIGDAFDEIVISAEVGLVKPDPRIYALILERLDVPAMRAIFIDDFEENVAAATRIGLRAVHFLGSAQAMEAVTNLLNS